MKTRLITLILPFVLLFSFVACQDDKVTEEENIIVPPGKADNFLSMSAQEYVVSGVSTVTLESSYADKSDEEKIARVKELIEYKHVVIGWFLNQYIIDKSDHDDNEGYGGFHSLVKNGAIDDLEITPVDNLTYSFKFQQLIGGDDDLLSILPTETKEDGKRHFELILGKVSNSEMAKLETNYEWYRRSPWSSFNPSELSEDQLERLDVTIWPEERSSDGWIDYNRLFADGVLTVDVHFGWDYHNNYHEVHSESLYNWLIAKGFKSPVESYADYNRHSGPLTKTITANGKSLKIEISIFWGHKNDETNPDTSSGGIILEEDMRESFRTKDVIVYSGHSGPFYGFALANWNRTYEGDLDDSEIPELDMPADKYQLVLAEGCDTYALGQAFSENPAKAGLKNIDIITTTNSSNAATPATVKDFLNALINTDYHKSHRPVLFSDLLKDLDRNSYWFNTMYGVHGIDDNPRVHPYADLSVLCQPCSENADCGTLGTQCSRLSNSEKVCTVQCTDDSGCPEGYTCQFSASGGYLRSKQCVPNGFSCENPEPVGKTLIINEILADPPADISGDSNGDGVRHYSEDEFIEFVNVSSSDMDISGWTVSDGFMVRFTFPENTVVSAGKAVVVFGGGDVTDFTMPEGVLVFAASNGLGLNNKGDTITLADKYGSNVDVVTYGSEAGMDKSITRSTDGDPDASFIQHQNTPFSPGLKSDGSAF